MQGLSVCRTWVSSLHGHRETKRTAGTGLCEVHPCVFGGNNCRMITTIALVFTKDIIRMPGGEARPAKIEKQQ